MDFLYYAHSLWKMNLVFKHMLLRYCRYWRSDLWVQLWSLEGGDTVGDINGAPPTSPLVACAAQRHFWIQTSACSGPVEHAQQYAKVRWVPRVPLNGTSSSALSSHAQHKMLQYNTTPYKTNAGDRVEAQSTQTKRGGPQCVSFLLIITYEWIFPLIHTHAFARLIMYTSVTSLGNSRCPFHLSLSLSYGSYTFLPPVVCVSITHR